MYAQATPMHDTWLLERLRDLIPLVLSLTVHEWAHAYSAYRLGDDTAQRMGRLTLNPIAHIDPFGTLLLPLLGVPFGWARPVPVNPLRFTRKIDQRTGMMLTAAAGPLSNLALAALCIIVYGVSLRMAVDNDALGELLMYGFSINIMLAFFNLLPIPPLDGSRIADWLVPTGMRPQWERVVQYGPMLLLALIFLPRMLGVSLFQWPVQMAWRGLAVPFLSAMAAGS
jgi:Zn-dependent protease